MLLELVDDELDAFLLRVDDRETFDDEELDDDEAEVTDASSTLRELDFLYADVTSDNAANGEITKEQTTTIAIQALKSTAFRLVMM